MTNRILIDSTQFKVSKPGVDVISASTTSPDNLLLSADTQNLGVFMSGQATIHASVPYSGSTAYIGETIMFPYDLGYIPYVMSHWSFIPNEAWTAPANSESYRYITPNDAAIDRAYYLYPFSDRLRLWKWGSSSLYDVTIRYTVFYTKAGT